MDIPQLKKLFPGMEDALYNEMLLHGSVRDVQAGDTILDAGQTIRSMMMVVEGIVKIYREDEEGGEFFMYDIQPGQACAVSMVCDFHHQQSGIIARALTDSVICSIPLQYMDEWMMKYRTWHYFVIQTYRARFEELLHTIDAIAFKNMDERLEIYLLKQVKQFGNVVKLTHQDIANDLNSSREVISRLMKKLENNGRIIIHRNAFEWVSELKA